MMADVRYWLILAQEVLSLVAVILILCLGVAGVVGGMIYLFWGRR